MISARTHRPGRRWGALALPLALLLATGCAPQAPPPPTPPPPLAAPAPAPPPPPVVETGQAFVRAAGLNLRQCPGKHCRVLVVLAQGQPVRVVEQQGAWCQVELEDGRRGWVDVHYLSGQFPRPKRVRRAAPAAPAAPPGPPQVHEEFAAPEPPPEGAPATAAPPEPREEFTR